MKTTTTTRTPAPAAVLLRGRRAQGAEQPSGFVLVLSLEEASNLDAALVLTRFQPDELLVPTPAELAAASAPPSVPALAEPALWLRRLLARPVDEATVVRWIRVAWKLNVTPRRLERPDNVTAWRVLVVTNSMHKWFSLAVLVWRRPPLTHVGGAGEATEILVAERAQWARGVLAIACEARGDSPGKRVVALVDSAVHAHIVSHWGDDCDLGSLVSQGPAHVGWWSLTWARAANASLNSVAKTALTVERHMPLIRRVIGTVTLLTTAFVLVKFRGFVFTRFR